MQPRAIIVIGSSVELKEVDQYETFERFRRSLYRVDIVTFDELVERAKYIVDDAEGDDEA